ncbi:MAG: sensor histidine kinase [Spirochaetaceae bacterium]|nr:MAG: sensor histidine kinase [Spirochaetaceae bacterium]
MSDWKASVIRALLPWQEQLLTRILRITLALGLPAVVAGVITAVNAGAFLIAVANITAYILTLIVYVLRKRFYTGAALLLCVIVFVLGAVILLRAGPLSAAMLLLVMPPALAVLLLEERAYQGIRGVTVLALVMVTVLLHLDRLSWSVSLPLWYTLLGTYFMTVLALTSAVRFLLVRLALAVGAEQDLKAGKEALLQEVHHRVRNNLQVIMSLLSLHQKQVTTEETRTALEIMRGRIAAMALSYDYLDTEGPELLVDLYSVLEEIALERAGNVPVALCRDRGNDSILLGLEQATVIALLVAEILWNCPACRELHIELESREVRILFRSAPAELPEATRAILSALSGQIRGRIELSPSPEEPAVLTVPLSL